MNYERAQKMVTEAAAQVRADATQQLLSTKMEEVEKRETIYFGLAQLDRIEWALQQILDKEEPKLVS